MAEKINYDILRKNLQTIRSAGGGQSAVDDYLAELGIDPKDISGMVPQARDAATLGNYARQIFGQGMALGLGDEIVGAMRGIVDAATSDKTFGKAISEGIDEERKEVKAFEQQYPERSLGLQLGGGLLTGGAGAARVGAMKAGQTIGPKIAQALKVGVPMGGAGGLGFSEGGLTPEGKFSPEGALSRGIGLGLGLGTGGALSAAVPLGTAAVGKYIAAPIARMMPGGAERQAKGLFREAAKEDELTSAAARKALDDMPPEAVVADVGGESMRDMARWAGSKFGGKASTKMLRERQEAQGWRVTDTLDELETRSLDDFLENTANLRRTQANKDYGVVYSREVPVTPELAELMENPVFQEMYRKAGRLAKYDNVKLPKLVKTEEGITTYAKPTVRSLDYMKQALDDKVNKLYRGGSGQEASKAKALRDNLRDVMDDAIPEYKVARSNYAGYAAAEEAADLGKKFIQSPRTRTPNWNKMGDHEKEAFRVGVVDELRFKVMTSPDGADVIKKIFGNKLARERLKSVFEPDDFATLEKRMLQEKAMFETHGKFGGSQTAVREMDVGTAGKTAGVMSDVLRATAGDLGGAASLVGRVKARAGAPPEAVAKHLSSYLLNPDPMARAKALEILKVAPRLRQGGRLIPGALPGGLSGYAPNINPWTPRGRR